MRFEEHHVLATCLNGKREQVVVPGNVDRFAGDRVIDADQLGQMLRGGIDGLQEQPIRSEGPVTGNPQSIRTGCWYPDPAGAALVKTGISRYCRHGSVFESR